MTDIAQIAEVARQLSAVARSRLMGEEDGNCPLGVAVQFVRLDLIQPSDDDEGWSWSPLGLSVRAYLLSQSDITERQA